MNWIAYLLLAISILLFAQSAFSLYLMLYTWDTSERLLSTNAPLSFLAPRYSFSVLLPARHEEAVIYQTIKSICAANYPAHLLEVVVICHVDDHGTVAEAQRAIYDLRLSSVRVVTFNDGPINKPHGLNVGMRSTSHQVVTVFDAEDDIDRNIFNMINTVMIKEGVGVVQGGVQLMNFKDHWFGIHNCLEYFFWFKSRLHFHARVGMIPLGGNTVFIRRDLLQRVNGWDEHCLTEDADIGLRLSVLGEPIRVIYDAQHVTREETPDTISSFIKQRTRWQQGFLQILWKGTWREMPHFWQRALAGYTLSYPYFQAMLTVLIPLTLIEIFLLKEPVIITMLSFLPLYTLALQLIISIVGAFLFTHEYKNKFSLVNLLMMIITFLPYQWMLGISAIRGTYREVFKQNNWEKTTHRGAHRHVGENTLPTPPVAINPASYPTQQTTYQHNH